MSNPVIITCAITGAETTKERQPSLPVTPKEQAKAVQDAVAAGASIIHLHVREDDGTPSQRLERFEEVISKIRSSVPDVIIQISTGGAVGETIKNRLAPLKLRPEMASLNMGSMNFGDDIFINTVSDIKTLAQEIYKNDIVPELEIYDAGMIETAARLLKEGFLQVPLHFQFVLGVPGGMSGDVRNLSHLRYLMNKHFQSESHWAVAGIGRYEMPLAYEAIHQGGHVRVGLEDNIYIEKGVLAESNAQLVEKVVKMSKTAGRPVASIQEARKILGLK